MPEMSPALQSAAIRVVEAFRKFNGETWGEAGSLRNRNLRDAYLADARRALKAYDEAKKAEPVAVYR